MTHRPLLVLETTLTVELVSLIDARLSELTDKYGDPEYADLLGYYDFIEHLTGLGFVACQAYMVTVYGILGVEKDSAMSSAPMHRCGRSIVAIVNAAANYWKHNHEWHLDKTLRQRRAIEEAFEDIGFPVGTEYPLSGILAELAVPADASFRAIMNQLAEWRSKLEACAV